MAIPFLRDAFSDTTKATVDLGNKTWQHVANDTLKFKRAVRGEGAKILVPTAKDRAIPALVPRGAATQILEGFEMVGQRPDGAPWDKNKEAQHFIRLDGMKEGKVRNCWFHNGWGDAVYFNKGADGSLCDGVEIVDCDFEEMGRHHVTPNAVQNSALVGGTMGWSARAPVDVEPDGKSWGARWFDWINTLITAEGNHFPVFANKGAGGNDSVHHITIRNIRCPNRPFSVTINPVPGPGEPEIRRHDLWISDCYGKGPKGVNQPQIILKHVDRAWIHHVLQPVTRGELVEVNFCADVWHDGKKIA